MFKISSFRKFAMFFRTSVKIIILTILSAFLIISAVAFFYKPTYAVSLNGEIIGYTENKADLQNKIKAISTFLYLLICHHKQQMLV